MKKRTLLKLSGESLGAGKVGIDAGTFHSFAKEIVSASRKGVEIVIVAGGGNFFRGKELSQLGFRRSRADYMGMLGTMMNCLALASFLEREGQEVRVQSAIAMTQIAEPYVPLKAIRHLQKGRIVILGCGAGIPYFSTDTVAIQRALELGCQEVLMGKNGIDGVYTADPRKDPAARKFLTLSYQRALMDNLVVMDTSAFSLARDNAMPIRVFDVNSPNAVERVLSGEKLGTLVSECETTMA